MTEVEVPDAAVAKEADINMVVGGDEEKRKKRKKSKRSDRMARRNTGLAQSAPAATKNRTRDSDSEEADLVVLMEKSDGNETEEVAEAVFASPPTSPPMSPLRERNADGGSSSKCAYCASKFGIMRQKRKCRCCEHNCCSDCCSVRVSYPPPYAFKSPKFVCNSCAPKIFQLRHSFSKEEASVQETDGRAEAAEAPAKKDKSTKKGLSKSLGDEAGKSDSPGVPLTQRVAASPMLLRKRSKASAMGGSFHTAGDCQVHAAFKVADPVCRLMFRMSGMYDGGKFDRSTLAKAMKVKTALKFETVGSVERMLVRVPAVIENGKWQLASRYPDPDVTDGKGWHHMPVFVYKPKTYDGETPLPVVLWYHGGGFCLGSIEDQMYQSICRRLCNSVHCIVVSVEYRLAPEFKFPHQLEDCYRALEWVHARGEEAMNADVSRIALAGDSAGGSLSAILSVMARDRQGPKLVHQGLVYPCMADPCTDENESQITYKNGPVLTRTIMTWFMEQMLPDPEDKPRYLFPLLFEDLSGLPSATIINAQHDPLCDHGILYFNKLRDFSVPVTHTTYRNSIHGFFGSQIGESDEAILELSVALSLAFRTS